MAVLPYLINHFSDWKDARRHDIATVLQFCMFMETNWLIISSGHCQDSDVVSGEGHCYVCMFVEIAMRVTYMYNTTLLVIIKSKQDNSIPVCESLTATAITICETTPHLPLSTTM